MKLLKTIKNPETYIEMDNTSGEYDYMQGNIIVEHRSNNPKRDYLFVNKLQCKHIPASPTAMINMCKTLANKVNKVLANETQIGSKVLVIGFAETATAIGSIVANNLCSEAYIMHTTREEVPCSTELIRFEEEHSHATTQKLLTWEDTDTSEFLKQFSYVLFVEDEISKGNTILNFIKAFKKAGLADGHELKFGVASVCNWQNEVNTEKFKSENIDTFYLLRGELKDVNAKMFSEVDEVSFAEDNNNKNNKHAKNVNLDFKGDSRGIFLQERLGYNEESDMRNTAVYSDCISQVLSLCKGADTVRIIGTEEFMAVPIEIGTELEKFNIDVICHATTRSKIDVICTGTQLGADEIYERYSVPSAYEEDRLTYIYDLKEKTDVVILISDTVNKQQFIELALSIEKIIDNSETLFITVRV